MPGGRVRMPRPTEDKKIYAGLCRPGSGRPGGRPLRSVTSNAAGRADVGIGPYETMKRNAAHKTADADRHDR